MAPAGRAQVAGSPALSGKGEAEAAAGKEGEAGGCGVVRRWGGTPWARRGLQARMESGPGCCRRGDSRQSPCGSGGCEPTGRAGALPPTGVKPSLEGQSVLTHLPHLGDTDQTQTRRKGMKKRAFWFRSENQEGPPLKQEYFAGPCFRYRLKFNIS